jgi:hypothetical protein
MPTPKYAAYKAADPYFNLVRRALGDLVEGDHFFDIIAEDTIYEVLYDLGWPRVIRGRADLMKAFKGYVDIIRLQSADKLVVHSTDAGRVIVIEYEVHIENLKISHWRDYMDSHAAWNALSPPAR